MHLYLISIIISDEKLPPDLTAFSIWESLGAVTFNCPDKFIPVLENHGDCLPMCSLVCSPSSPFVLLCYLNWLLKRPQISTSRSHTNRLLLVSKDWLQFGSIWTTIYLAQPCSGCDSYPATQSTQTEKESEWKIIRWTIIQKRKDPEYWLRPWVELNTVSNHHLKGSPGP